MSARGKGGVVLLALLSAALLAAAGAGDARAQQGRDRGLPGCGICFPDGYDVNTVGRVQGTLLEVQLPEDGPVRLVVAGRSDRWVVLASPTWFWKMTDLRLAPGDTVAVLGSKTLGADGTLYVVAREILPPGAATAVVVRDSRGAPLWSDGQRDGGGGRRGGPGAVHGAGMGRGRSGGTGRR